MLISQAIAYNWPDHSVMLKCPDDYEGSFSRSQCDGCGSTLGGDRCPASAWPTVNGWEPVESHNLNVCIDCVAYLANGEDAEVAV